MSNINLGDKVKDVICNITGIATCRQEALNGCVQFLIEMTASSNGEAKEDWIDEQRLKAVKRNVFKEQPSTATTGGMKKEAQTKER